MTFFNKLNLFLREQLLATRYVLGVLALCFLTGIVRAQTTKTFSYTGAVQTSTVPTGVTSLPVVANGTQDGAGISSAVGTALNFDGTNDYVNCGNAANLQIATGTIEGWIKTSGAGASYRGIIVKQLAYSLFLVDGVLGVFNWGGGVAVSTGVNLADNQWHHVALSFQNGVTNGSVIYIDGTARTTFTLNISNQTVGLAIGAGQPSVSQNFNGTIDEVRVWNTARTASQIANSRSCELAGNETGLVSYYKFNQGVAESANPGVTTLTDATTNANNGTLTNFALTGATSNWVLGGSSVGAVVTPSVSIAASPSGAITAGTNVTFTATPTNGGTTPTYVWKKGSTTVGTNSATYANANLQNGDVITCDMTSNATCTTTATATSTGITMTVGAAPKNGLNFDGVNDLVNCGNATNLRLSTGTIEAWVKTSGAGASFRAIVVKQYAYSLFLNNNVLVAYDWTTGSEKSTGVNLADGQWHHVAFAFQPTANLSKIYIDGVPRLTIASAWGVANQTVPLHIGAGGDVSAPHVQCFNGNIDGVRVWNTARTDAQIASDYSCQLTGSESGLVACYNFNHGIAAGTNTGLTTLTDATANANNGTLTNFALTGATSNWVAADILTEVTPSVAIAASPSGAITTGTSVTFTATSTNGGASPTYVWKKGGEAISGATSATYTSSTLVNGDIITCTLTNTGTCLTTTTATSTGITITILSSSPSVTIAASSTTICAGTSVTFTATPTNGGTTPQYQWKNGMTDVGTGATYTTTSLANNDVITCVLTSNLPNVSPTTATSAGITMTVNALPTITGVSNQAVCVGTNTTPITFTGTGATSYTWTNTNTATGLAASGTGDIAAFAATNSTGAAITSTVTVTPVSGSPEYAYIANVISNNVSVINTSTNTVVATIVVGTNPRGVAVSPDGSRVYVTNSASNNVSVINTTTNTVVATVVVGTNPAGVSVSPDGSRVYVANEQSATVSVINTTTNAVEATVAVGTNPQGVSISPDGSRVYVANYFSNTVSVVNTSTNAVVATVAVGLQPYAVSVSPDGSRVYVENNSSNNVSVINTTTNAVVATVPVGSSPYGLSVSPDGSRVYVTNYQSNNVSVINTTTNAVVATVTVGSGPAGVSVSPDGSRVYVCNYFSATVSVINTSTNTVAATVAVGTRPFSLGNFIKAGSAVCSGTPTTFTLTVNPPVTPSVSIAASPSGAITAGTSVTFTATPTNGGTTPTYQWKKGSTTVGTNSTTYTDAALQNGEVITCVLTPSTEICTSPASATSNGITMTVNTVPSTGEYLNFDGVDDAITATQQTTVSNNFTIEFWARPTGTIALPTQATGGFDAISGQRFVISPENAAGLGGSGAGVSVGTNGVCVAEHGGGYLPCILTWAGTVSGWTHIAVVYTNKQPTLYVNGALVATGLTSPQPSVFVTTSSYGGGPFGYYSGDMDELRIWDRSLTGTEISSRTTVELVGNEAGLIDYYKFNQGMAAGTNPSVTTLVDATTPTNNGTLTGFALTSTASNWLAPSPFTLCTLIPSVSVTANPSGGIAAGTSVTFTAVPTNGGTTPTYTWKKGSTTVGTNSATYSDATLVDGDVITCVMRPSSEICSAVETATSTGITIAVLPSPSVTIATSSTTICAGTSVTFTATPTNGGTTPQYQWKNGTTNVGTGVTYTTTGLANNDVITCVMTSNLPNVSPTTATSAGITMVVNTPPATPVISGATTFCTGGTTTLSTQTQAGASYCWTNSSATPAWQNVGSAGFSAGRTEYQSLAFYGSTPYVAYSDAGNGNKTTVMKYNGTTWVNVGNAGFSAGSADYQSLAFNGSTPYVAYQDGGQGNKATVMKYNGTAWENVGSAGFSAGGASYQSLAFNGSTPYVAYADDYNDRKTTVMKYNGTAWENVGSAGFSAGSAEFQSLAFNGSTPYVAYQDGGNNSKTTVMKYNGTAWENVGSAGFSAGLVTYQSLAFNGSTPYVAYNDGTNYKTTVMKYNGTAWENVGNAGFSAGDANFQSLAFGGSTPYVAYQDGANNGKTTVMKYNGTAWENVGSAGFSAGGASYQSLAFNGSTPYVAYRDGANGGKTTVMKFGLPCLSSSNSLSVSAADTYTVTITTNGCTATASQAVTVGTICSYTWTGATSTDWATATNWNPNGIPSPTDNVIIPTTTNKPMLPANQTIANMNLTGTNKIMLGNSTLCVNAITGGSSSSYVVTDGTGGLLIKAISTTATVFPVGPSETAYAPATIMNNVARDFTVKVGTTLTNAAALVKTVNLQWDITPSVLTGNSATLALGWSTANQNSAFNPNAAVEIAHYNTSSSIWDRFRLATVTGSNPYVATVSGVDAFSPFVVANQNALSVELLDFKATPQYNGNLLTWTTANEVNNKGFNVERLMENGQWITLGFVNAKGKSATYDFVDNSPLPTSYYRLRQIDNDGKETLSKVVSVSRNNSTKLKVYPNPVSNTLTIETQNTGDYQIINLLGQTLLRGTATTQNIDVSALPQGSYVLKVGAEQVKFLKQ